jgi:hypothetical protein
MVFSTALGRRQRPKALRPGVVSVLRASAANLAALCISLIVALLIAEAIVRGVYGTRMVLYPRYHTSARFGAFTIRRIRPNMSFTHTSADGTFHFRTNNRGFRNDSDIEYVKEPGEVRVLSLGDSHTQGYEVNQDQTFSAVAERELRAQGIQATVMNAGVSGFSTIEELIFLENEGYKYHPDYVVLGFYANDFLDNVRTQLMAVRADSLVVLHHEYTPGVSVQDRLYPYRVFRFLGEHSYLYALVFNAVWDHFKHRSIAAARRPGGGAQPSDESAVAGGPLAETDYDLMAKVVERMHAFCRSHGTKLIIVDIPQLHTVSSIPPVLLPKLRTNSDTLYYVGDMGSEYGKLSTIHVPHGQRHISAETHALLGHKIAEYIRRDRLKEGRAARRFAEPPIRARPSDGKAEGCVLPGDSTGTRSTVTQSRACPGPRHEPLGKRPTARGG